MTHAPIKEFGMETETSREVAAYVASAYGQADAAPVVRALEAAPDAPAAVAAVADGIVAGQIDGWRRAGLLGALADAQGAAIAEARLSVFPQLMAAWEGPPQRSASFARGLQAILGALDPTTREQWAAQEKRIAAFLARADAERGQPTGDMRARADLLARMEQMREHHKHRREAAWQLDVPPDAQRREADLCAMAQLRRAPSVQLAFWASVRETLGLPPAKSGGALADAPSGFGDRQPHDKSGDALADAPSGFGDRQPHDKSGDALADAPSGFGDRQPHGKSGDALAGAPSGFGDRQPHVADARPLPPPQEDAFSAADPPRVVAVHVDDLLLPHVDEGALRAVERLAETHCYYGDLRGLQQPRVDYYAADDDGRPVSAADLARDALARGAPSGRGHYRERARRYRHVAEQWSALSARFRPPGGPVASAVAALASLRAAAGHAGAVLRLTSDLHLSVALALLLHTGAGRVVDPRALYSATKYGLAWTLDEIWGEADASRLAEKRPVAGGSRGVFVCSRTRWAELHAAEGLDGRVSVWRHERSVEAAAALLRR